MPPRRQAPPPVPGVAAVEDSPPPDNTMANPGEARCLVNIEAVVSEVAESL